MQYIQSLVSMEDFSCCRFQTIVTGHFVSWAPSLSQSHCQSLCHYNSLVS